VKAVKVVVKSAAALVAVAVIIELAARVFLPGLAWLDVLEPTAWGYTARPSFSASYTGMPGAGMDAPFSTAADGSRGAMTMRQASLVAIGNSYTFGLGVTDDATWPAQLADETTWTVANMGLPGLDMAMALARLQAMGLRMRGKTVVWVVASDDTRRTPAEGWLAVRKGAARWLRSLAWMRVQALPKGAELSGDPAARLSVEDLLAAGVQLAEHNLFRLVVVRLSRWRSKPVPGLLLVDVSDVFTRLQSDPSTLAEDGIQLNRAGNRRVAAAIASKLATMQGKR